MEPSPSHIAFRLWFFFQAEYGIRDLVRSRGLGDVYKRQDIRHVNVLILIFRARQEKSYVLRMDSPGNLVSWIEF